MAWLQQRAEHRHVVGRKCAVQIHIPFPDERRRDPHNYSSTILKVIVDALTRQTEVSPDGKRVVVWEGCWEDDNPNFVRTLEPIIYKGDLCLVRIVPDD